MRHKLLLFDFDGTIADTLPPLVNYVNSHRKELGITFEDELNVKDLQGKTIGEIMSIFKYPLFKLPFFIRKVRQAEYDLMNNVKIPDGLEKTLIDLKKRDYNLAVVTSNSRKNVEKFLDERSLGMFDFIISNLNIFGKARTLKSIMNDKKFMDSKIVYVGDEVRDIQACKEIGMPIISVTWGFNSKELLARYKPDVLIDKPVDLIAAAEGLM